VEWLIYGTLAALLAGCFIAGTLPGERWMDLVRGWDKVRFSTTKRERFLNVMGVVANVGTQVITGLFRLLAFSMGAGMIVWDRAGQRIGEWLPTYPKGKELESGNHSERDGDSEI